LDLDPKSIDISATVSGNLKLENLFRQFLPSGERLRCKYLISFMSNDSKILDPT
jgi:hypothetical protein